MVLKVRVNLIENAGEESRKIILGSNSAKSMPCFLLYKSEFVPLEHSRKKLVVL